MSDRMMFSRSRSTLAVVVLLVTVIGAAISQAAAAPRRPTHARTRREARAHLAESRARAEAEAIATKKAAVFAFEGDGAERLRDHVVRVFEDNRMRVATDLRAPDRSRYLAEQFRDMAAALDLSVYVHGRIKSQARERAVATIVIRSGVTGRPVAHVRFEGSRRELPGEVREKLWDKVRTAVARACTEASHGRRRHNKPTRIEAGTPL